MKKLKVLNKGLISPFRNFKYEIGKEYVCEDFDGNPNNDCSKGFYASDIEGLPYSWNIHMECYEVEVSGKHVIYNQFKQRFEKQTIIRKLEKDEMISLALAKEIDLEYKLSEVLFPINPLLLPQTPVTEKEIELLKQWDSIMASVGDSIMASVGDSVEDSVGDSVGDSVMASVMASVRDSVRDSVRCWHSVRASAWAYISSLFPNITKWKYIDHEEGVNPFQSGIDLWKSGFVPSFNGTTSTWRLLSGATADIVYESNANS